MELIEDDLFLKRVPAIKDTRKITIKRIGTLASYPSKS
jgi:hypothetical protein